MFHDFSSPVWQTNVCQWDGVGAPFGSCWQGAVQWGWSPLIGTSTCPKRCHFSSVFKRCDCKTFQCLQFWTIFLKKKHAQLISKISYTHQWYHWFLAILSSAESRVCFVYAFSVFGILIFVISYRSILQSKLFLIFETILNVERINVGVKESSFLRNYHINIVNPLMLEFCFPSVSDKSFIVYRLIVTIHIWNIFEDPSLISESKFWLKIIKLQPCRLQASSRASLEHLKK